MPYAMSTLAFGISLPFTSSLVMRPMQNREVMICEPIFALNTVWPGTKEPPA